MFARDLPLFVFNFSIVEISELRKVVRVLDAQNALENSAKSLGDNSSARLDL